MLLHAPQLTLYLWQRPVEEIRPPIHPPTRAPSPLPHACLVCSAARRTAPDIITPATPYPREYTTPLSIVQSAADRGMPAMSRTIGLFRAHITNELNSIDHARVR